MLGLGVQELLVLFLIVLVLFGAKRLPEIGAGLGKAIRSFKDGVTSSGDTKEIDGAPAADKKRS